MKIAVLGAGAWGTALAMAAAARHDTLLWARSPAQAQALAAERCNRRYLGDLPFPSRLNVTADHGQALAHARDGLTLIATPMAGLREQLARLPDGRPVLWLCKGFEASSGALGHEVARDTRPGAAAGVLSGPSFALEVARSQPTALVAASHDAALCEAAVAALHSEALRVYTSTDVVGVEVGGAVKNVLAIATGIVDGLAAAANASTDVSTDCSTAAMAGTPGLNARAALITRGLAEMTRLGVALGARPDTFMGLSGLGDLVLTATGDLSRNRKVGLLLAQGQSLAEVLQHLGHVSEGVYSAVTVLDRARRLGVDMPITSAVVDMLQGRLRPADAPPRLMGREARAEG